MYDDDQLGPLKLCERRHLGGHRLPCHRPFGRTRVPTARGPWSLALPPSRPRTAGPGRYRR